MSEEEKEVYEIGFHVIPSVAEDKVQEVVLGLEGLINENGGSILSQEFPKMMNLAYEIKKRVETKYLNYNKTYFGWIKFEAPKDSLSKIDEGAKNNQNILRFILVKTVKESTIHIPKPPTIKTPSPKETKIFKDQVIEPKEKVEISEAEIDESIDKLLEEES